MEVGKVPIQPLTDILGPFCKHLEDVEAVWFVVGLLDCLCGEYMYH